MAGTDSHSFHTHKSRITSGLKQHIVSMVKDLIPLGNQRQGSIDGSQLSAPPRPGAPSWSQGPNPGLLTPPPNRPTHATLLQTSDSRTAPSMTHRSGQRGANMLLRSSHIRLTRSSRVRAVQSHNVPNQSSSSAKKRHTVRLAPNSSSANPKNSASSPSKCKEAAHTSTNDSQESSSSTTDPSEMLDLAQDKETLLKMVPDGKVLQPRLVLKRLRNCDFEKPKAKRPCLNDSQQRDVHIHQYISPAPKETLSPPPSPEPACTSLSSTPLLPEKACVTANSTQPVQRILTPPSENTTSTQPDCVSRNTCTHPTQSEAKQTNTSIPSISTQLVCTQTQPPENTTSTQLESLMTNTCPQPTQLEAELAHISITTNSAQLEWKLSHLCSISTQSETKSVDSIQSGQMKPSTSKSQPTSEPAHTTITMAHTSRDLTCPSSKPLSSPSHSNPRTLLSQGQTSSPLQRAHRLPSTQCLSRVTSSAQPTQAGVRGTFIPTRSPIHSVPRLLPRPAQVSETYIHRPMPRQAPAPILLVPRHPCSPGGVPTHHTPVSYTQSQHTHTPVSHPAPPRNTHVPLNRGLRPVSIFIVRPVNAACRPTNSQTPSSPVSRPIQQHISIPLHTSLNSASRPVHSHTSTGATSRPVLTPTQSVFALIRTPRPTNPSRATDSHAHAKPISTATITSASTNTLSRSTDSHTLASSMSTPTQVLVATNTVPGSTESCTLAKPVHTFTPNPVSGPAQPPRPIYPFFQRTQAQTNTKHQGPLFGPPHAKQPCVSSSGGAGLFTPPEYVQHAFVKNSGEGADVVMLKEKHSPVVPLSSNLALSSTASSSSSSSPAVPVRSSAKNLFPQTDGKDCSGVANESSGPAAIPLRPSSPAPCGGYYHVSGPDRAARSPSPPLDNLDDILTPDSPLASAGMDVDMTSPEASQDSPARSASPTGPSVTEPVDTAVMAAQAVVVTEEAAELKAEAVFPLKDPDTAPSQDRSGQEAASVTQVPPHQTRPVRSPEMVWVDPLEEELGLGDSLGGLDCSLSDTSSSEDERLLSLQELMERSVRPPPTPDKDAFPEPSTPVVIATVEPIKAKAVSYKNTLDQMLIEREQNQRSKVLEEELLQGCQEDLLLSIEEEEGEEDKEGEEGEAKEEEDISQEQHKFVRRYTLTSSTIRDLPPGEELFSLGSFGRLFTQDSLVPPSEGISPQNTAQRILLRASPKQALSLVQAGLLTIAYASSPCPPVVARWLFQMMSVHSNLSMSGRILQALKEIALTAGLRIVEQRDLRFRVWVPSLQDVAQVVLNMGAPFVSMFPLETLQPPFTEADLLGSTAIGPEGQTCGGSEHASFPEHNFDNMTKYLCVCAALCPREYSDQELLLLMTMFCRLSLDTHLLLFCTANLSELMLHLVSNISDWNTQLPLVCRALTDLTEDHHNLRRLVHLLPLSNRGRELRKHLSLSIISKLLNLRCTYRPAGTEFQLSDLVRYVPHMSPSFLKKQHIAKRPDLEQAGCIQDEQAYYLCYSLLDLTNEASNYDFLRPDQKIQIKLLSAQLEKHVKCDIRETEKRLYRSKVKDYLARIYTRWQVLLQRTRPVQGKLYDFWEPLPEDVLGSNQEEQREQRRPQPRACGEEEPEERASEEEEPEERASEEEEPEERACEEEEPEERACEEEEPEERASEEEEPEERASEEEEPEERACEEEEPEERACEEEEPEERASEEEEPEERASEEEEPEERASEEEEPEERESEEEEPEERASDMEEEPEPRAYGEEETEPRANGEEEPEPRANEMEEEPGERANEMEEPGERTNEEEPEVSVEEMSVESLGNKTVIEKETIEEVSNKEVGLSAEVGLGKAEGQQVEGERLHVEEGPDRREGLPEEEAPVKENEELAMEEESAKEVHPDKEVQMEEPVMEVEEQATEDKTKIEEQSPNKGGPQVEGLEMMETGSRPPDQGEPITDEPMTEVEAETR
ncbi:hypothetical protein ACEWY4_021287 [Coilia grayii]|uniref:Coiled-coil SMC6 And NSE5 INteracting (CANIN) domain-containing protein n=1 Tax=Coilia grayii TaxID=363190 RepID=A0ABD1J9T3_9TELE